MADLHDTPRGALRGRAHELRLFQRERHGLFLVDVLARFHGRGETIGVQMLRRGDDHGIDRGSASISR